jgi:hypothetical protein
MTYTKEQMREYVKEWRKNHPGYQPNTDASIRKTCTKCKAEFPATAEFFGKERTRPLGVGSQCKSCQSKRAALYNKTHRVASNERTRIWRRKNERKYTLRYGYNMTVEQYDALFNAQGGVCAICSEPPKDHGKRRLAVDHCHRSGKNRGLLCALCNHAVERFEKDPDFGTKVLNYLARYIEQTVKG